MMDTLGILIGSLLDIIGFVSHLVIVIFRNILLLAFILAIFYGMFKLGRYGFRHLRSRLWERADKSRSAPEGPAGKPEDGGK